MSEAQTPRATHADTGVRLPAAVQAQIERANAAMEQQRNPPAPEGEGQGDTPAIQTLRPVEERADPPTNGQQPPQDGQPQQPPQDGQPQQPQPRDDQAEQRYRSLEGRYRADMQRMEQQLQSYQTLLANIQTAAPPKPDDKPVESFRVGPDAELTEDERRDYGPDLITVIEKVAKRVAYSVGQELRQEVQQVQQSVGKTEQVTKDMAFERFKSDLTREVSDWVELNSNPGFLEWLNKPDAYSGVARYELLQKAVQENSAARAAAFFQGYKRELQAVSPQGSQPAASSPAPSGQGTGRVPLESLAAPGRAKPGASGAPQDKPVYKVSDIPKFYDDVRRGVYKGREAEQRAKEADIFAAQQEGRLIPG